MRHAIAPSLLALALAGCGEPTPEDVEQAEEARREQLEYCLELRDEMADNRDRPLIRATLQERYNRDCLGATYPEPGDG